MSDNFSNLLGHCANGLLWFHCAHYTSIDEKSSDNKEQRKRAGTAGISHLSGTVMIFHVLLCGRPQQTLLLRKPVASTATVNTLSMLVLIAPQVFTFADYSSPSPALPPSTPTRASPSCASIPSHGIHSSSQPWHMWLCVCIIPAVVRRPEVSSDCCQWIKPHLPTANPCSCTPADRLPQLQSLQCMRLQPAHATSQCTQMAQTL